jgi:hypothetical protein
MGLAEVDAERLGALDQPGDVGVPAQQVVDELDPLRLLGTDHLPPLGLVAVDQHADGVVEDPQHRLGGAADLLRVRRAHHDRQLPPEPPGGGQIQVHCPPGTDPLRGGAASQLADGVQFPCVRPSAVDRGVGQQRQVLPEQLRRRSGVGRRGRGDRGQPIVGRGGRRWPAQAVASRTAGHGAS